MKIRVLGKDGPVMVEAETLTFIEHEEVISHWEAVFTQLHVTGRYDDETLGRKLEMCRRAREQLFAGKIPYKQA